jgi:hypothetical protein
MQQLQQSATRQDKTLLTTPTERCMRMQQLQQSATGHTRQDTTHYSNTHLLITVRCPQLKPFFFSFLLSPLIALTKSFFLFFPPD